MSDTDLGYPVAMARRPSNKRHRLGIELGSLTFAVGGTLAALVVGAGPVPEHPSTTMAAESDFTEVLAWCHRGYSSVDSGAGISTDGFVDPDPRFLEQACELAGGTGCDFSQVVPRETAMCVAEQDVLGEGGAYRASLAYDAAAALPVWRIVSSPRAPDGTLACDTTVVTIDAMAGRVVRWESARDPFCAPLRPDDFVGP